MSVVEQLESRAEEAERQAERLRKVAQLARELGDEGLEELALLMNPTNGNGHTNGSGNGNGHSVTPKVPRGREAVRLIVTERPGTWTLKQLRAEMEEREWFTSSKGLDVAVKRLCDAGEAERTGHGEYRFVDNRKEGVIESDASDGAVIPLDM